MSKTTTYKSKKLNKLQGRMNMKKTTLRHIIVKFWRAEQRKNKNSKGRRKTTYNSTKNIKHLGGKDNL